MKRAAVILLLCLSAQPAFAQMGGYLWGFSTGYCPTVAPMCMIGVMNKKLLDEQRAEEERLRREADPSLFKRTPENKR